MSFAALSAKATAISPPYKEKIAQDAAFWKGSAFDWMRCLPSRTRGTIGLTLAMSVFQEYGHTTKKRKDEFDVDDTTKIISRSSMLWEDDHWKFQQVRDTAFDFLFCLGINPTDASAWLIPKSELYLSDGSLTDRDGWKRQHGGKSGKEDAWLIVYPTDVPAWLGSFGGDIAKISKVFKKYL